jgi:serine kinase of HPr protein (carbohydrate metabolism regulator)
VPTALIPSPALLVADDRVQTTRSGGRLMAQAPATIRGQLEVRGVGIVSVPYAPSAELVLAADLVAPGEIERLPDPMPEAEIMGVRLKLIKLAPFESSAPIKLLLALAQLFARPEIVV